MADQIIDAAQAREIHASACQASPLAGWLVAKNPPGYLGKVVARLVTDAASPYVPAADTPGEIQAQLPGRLRSQSQPKERPIDV